jgi:hypothetical protein
MIYNCWKFHPDISRGSRAIRQNVPATFRSLIPKVKESSKAPGVLKQPHQILGPCVALPAITAENFIEISQTVPELLGKTIPATPRPPSIWTLKKKKKKKKKKKDIYIYIYIY